MAEAKNILPRKKKEGIPLNEKVELLKEYSKTGKTINGKTEYKGYPIGLWAISMKSAYKTGKVGKNLAKYLDELKKIGVINDKEISDPLKTIEGKIDAIAEWNSKFPELIVRRQISKSSEDKEKFINVIKKSIHEIAVKNELNEDELFERYIKLCSSYDYLSARYKHLSAEQRNRAKEKNLRGLFGFPKKIEDLAEKYGVSLEIMAGLYDLNNNVDEVFKISNRYGLINNKVIYILDRYGSIESFIENYKAGNVDPKDRFLSRNLVYRINIGEEIPRELEEDIFTQKSLICDDYVRIFDGGFVLEAIKDLPDKKRYVMEHRYGLFGANIDILSECGNALGVGKERIRQIQRECLDLIRDDCYKHSTCVFDRNIINLVFDSNLIIQGDFNVVKDQVPELLACYKKYLEEKKLAEEKEMEEEKDVNELPISVLKLGAQVTNRLLSNDINTIGDLRQLTRKKLSKINKLGSKGLEKVISSLTSYLNLSEEEVFLGLAQEQAERKKRIEAKSFGNDDIENLSLSFRANNVLHRKGLTTIGKLLEFLKTNTLDDIRGVGSKTKKEILDVLEEYLETKKEKTKEEQTDKTGISVLGLSKRSTNALYGAGIITVEQLSNLSLYELKRLTYLGEKSTKEIVEKLCEYLQEPKEKVFKEKSIEEKEECPIFELGLEGRTSAALTRCGKKIKNVSDLRKLSKQELLKISGITSRRVEEITKKLSEFLGTPEEEIFYKKSDEQCAQEQIGILSLNAVNGQKLLEYDIHTIEDLRNLSEFDLITMRYR